MLRRRFTKVVKQELNEIDYFHKLSKEESDYLSQFILEYYQGDFNFDNPIHGKEYIKDCRDRNNNSKRQWHSVGSKLKERSIIKALEKNSKYIEDLLPLYSRGDEE